MAYVYKKYNHPLEVQRKQAVPLLLVPLESDDTTYDMVPQIVKIGL